jgi:CAAX prenyl protease-like protein
VTSFWILFRIVGAVVVVPIAEELAFRGYLLRKLVAADFEKVPATRFTWFSFVASSVLFGLMHQSWLAGTIAGAAFAMAVYHRGRLSDAVVAHMTANALIAATAIGFGWWDLWL